VGEREDGGSEEGEIEITPPASPIVKERKWGEEYKY
jgi:hypothetical protein